MLRVFLLRDLVGVFGGCFTVGIIILPNFRCPRDPLNADNDRRHAGWFCRREPFGRQMERNGLCGLGYD